MATKTKNKSKKKTEDSQDILEIVKDKVGPELMRRGIDTGGVSRIPAVSTRSIDLDIAMGVGGIPYGRIVEIFGPESSGKTTLALSVCAQCQKDGGVAAYIDMEHAIDPTWCRTNGVQTSKVLFSQPDSAEQAFKIIQLLLSTAKAKIIVLDSVAALATEAELNGEPTDKFYPEAARLMSQELRKMKGVVSKKGISVIFINQIRDNIGGPMPGGTHTTGGRALRFYSSLRVDIRRIGTVKADGNAVGSSVAAKVVKNKVAPPFKTGNFDILYDKGISRSHELIKIANKHGIVEYSGSWVKYKDERLGQGQFNAGEFLDQNQDIADEIYTELMGKLYPATDKPK